MFRTNMINNKLIRGKFRLMLKLSLKHCLEGKGANSYKNTAKKARKLSVCFKVLLHVSEIPTSASVKSLDRATRT